MQIRLSPNGKINQSKKSPRKQQKKPKLKKADLPLSTNVSSPVQALPKRRRVAEKQITSLSNGDFQQSDDDEDYMERVDEAETEDDSDIEFEEMSQKPPTRSKLRRSVGPPIQVDKTLQDLDYTHQALVLQFVDDAKKKCKEVSIPNHHNKPLQICLLSLPRWLSAKVSGKFRSRTPCCAEWQLPSLQVSEKSQHTRMRNFDPDFLSAESQMLAIPGIDQDKVQRWGKPFLNLLKKAKDKHQEVMQPDLPPQDPNHKVTVIISSDEENEGAADASDDAESDGVSQNLHSRYFRPSPAVDQLNAKR